MLPSTLADFSPVQLVGGTVSSPLMKGGSDRIFERVSDSHGNSAIKMIYSEQRAENSRFARVAEMLDHWGLNVPKILHHDAQQRIIWMYDLGEVDLHSLCHQNAPEKIDAYKKALGQVARLHSLRPEDVFALFPDLELMLGFDEALYRWEQNYFLEHCVKCAMRLELCDSLMEKLCAEFEVISSRLCARERCFVHRDFQSQNVMWFRNEAWLIDFQGLRLGNPFYDVASLLYDPYVSLDSAERDDLLRFYIQTTGILPTQGKTCEDEFHTAGVQRLMQALGAYGNLGLNLGKTEYLNYFSPALENLSLAVSAVGRFPQLGAVVGELKQRASKLY